MKQGLRLLFWSIAFWALPASLLAQIITINGPAGSKKFGASAYALANGNYVVTDPECDNGTLKQAGAVYLYNGKTHALISTLRGKSDSDQVGWMLSPLANGNFIVRSRYWDNGSVRDAGAATWVNGITGLNGVVSASNSLVGSSANDWIGNVMMTLPNGNCVLLNALWDNGSAADAGAATWVDGSKGIAGVINSSNSFIGTQKNDRIGNGAQILSNGNYVIYSPGWNNGSIQYAGCVTWCNGKTGITGTASSSNSFVGASANDQIADHGIVELKNGNYVVISQHCRNGIAINAGAVTWCNGSSGLTGIVSTANSMMGVTANDAISVGGILTLTNGNYVILSPLWHGNNGPMLDAGAATWCNGATGGNGVVSNSNSLVGSSINEHMGNGNSAALSNGNYVITSQWKNGSAVNAGAATWCDGSTGKTGQVTTANSLVGTQANDGAGMRCFALPDGSYVVLSSWWSNGLNTRAGAATWCDGSTGRTGAISSSNSLVGSQANDLVGSDYTILSNGNYLVLSPGWADGAKAGVGAVTWADGSAGVTGPVGLSNSLIGGSAGDTVGERCITLTNGNYVVLSSKWDNGANTNAGAATWCSGTAATSAVVNTSNSMVGTHSYDNVGSFGSTALTNGNYVLASPTWDYGTFTDVGAATWLDGSKPAIGIISSSNSLVGRANNDGVGYPYPLADGNYVVESSSFSGSTYQGAVTICSGTGGTIGFPNTCNTAYGRSLHSPAFDTNSVYNYLVVGFGYDNKVSIIPITPQAIVLSKSSASRTFADTSAQTFVDTADKLICVLRPASPLTSTGVVTAKVLFESTTPSYNTEYYVRRHYDMSTASMSDTGNATTTLYFTQAEFDDYNANNGNTIDLPAFPTDQFGISHLRVTLQRGTSSTGMPGTYTGWSGSGPANVSYDPADANIVWNACDARWEVTFDMKGYGGLFIMAKKDNSPLSTQSFKKENGLNIAPVPASEAIRINVSDEKMIGQSAMIVDIYGRTIQEFRIQKDQQMDIHQLAAGTYYLRAGTSGVYKFVKL